MHQTGREELSELFFNLFPDSFPQNQSFTEDFLKIRKICFRKACFDTQRVIFVMTLLTYIHIHVTIPTELKDLYYTLLAVFSMDMKWG